MEDVLADFHHEAKAKFGVERLMTSRVMGLFVLEIDCLAFEIRETDGAEKVYDVSRRRAVDIQIMNTAAPPPVSATPTPASASAPAITSGTGALPATIGPAVLAGVMIPQTNPICAPISATASREVAAPLKPTVPAK